MPIRFIFSALFITFLSGCAISQDVQPVDSTEIIQKIYVKENPKVLMEGLLPEIVSQLNALGFESESYSGDLPENAHHYLTFTANWQWDMAMYLTYFRTTLYNQGRILGTAEYDAKSGGANMNKFGKTGEKIRPLLREMLDSARRAPTASPLGK